MATKSKPVQEIRIGRATASICANGAKGKPVLHNVTVQSLYKGEEGWRSMPSLGRDDLLIAGKVLSRAQDWIVEQKKR